MLKHLAHAAHALALSLWLCAVLGSALVAGVVFPTLKELAPSLPSHASYSGEHWRLLAGHVAARGFYIADILQTFAGGLALLSLGVLLLVHREGFIRILGVMRVVLTGASILVLCYYLLVLAPRMSANLRAYWDAAAQGRDDDALAAQRLFALDHPVATDVLGMLAVLVLTNLVLTLWNGAQGSVWITREPGNAQGRASRLPEPTLLKKAGR